jgi:capsid portal protein
MPIADVAAKDEFTGVKNTSRDDVLAAHRVPPQLLGVVPQTAGGFGDVQKAAAIFFKNEIEPLQGRFQELNDWLGVEAVRFGPYDVTLGLPASGGNGGGNGGGG